MAACSVQGQLQCLSAALGLAIATLATLLATSSQFGMVWDEGYTVRRERLLGQWFVRITDPARPGRWLHALEKPELDRYWKFSREEPNGHPPFYAILGLGGWAISYRWLPPLESYRFGPMLLISATVGLIYHHLARRRGPVAGIVASVLLIALPRSFAHAHYAHYDMPMTCLWLLAQVAFLASLDSRRWAVAYGVALGLAAGTKFTGLLAVLPAVAWVTAFELVPGLVRSLRVPEGVARPARPGLETLFIALPVAILTLYLIQPPWWIEPVAGPHRFLASNLSRAKTQPLPTFYRGTIYDFALPWHNTLVLTAVTTPVAVLFLGLIGLAFCLIRCRDEPSIVIWPLSWATLMIVRALPYVPGHDGIRLFLPSVASLAVLAGLGLSWLNERLEGVKRFVIPLLAAAAIGESLVGIVQTYPYTDSYFNVAIGGLKGAERAGFELTYYWETAGREFLDWVGVEARSRPVNVAFAMDSTNHSLMREWGEIPAGVQIIDLNSAPTGDPLEPDYYVQQRRRGLLYPDDQWLDQFGHPVFVIRRQGVDLLRVYTQQEALEAARRTGNQPVRRSLLRP
jgi:hypothetical protein